MKNYIIKRDNNEYVKDNIRNKEFLVKKIEHTEWLPSNGKSFTLYVLKNGDFYYGNNANLIQVIPEQVEVKEKAKQTKKVKKKKDNSEE